MNRQRSWIVPCALLLALALSGRVEAGETVVAATPAADSPEAVIEVYAGAMRGGQFQKAAEVMDPEGLEWMRATVIQFVEGVDPSEQKEVLRVFGGVDDMAALRKLSPAAFFGSFFGAVVSANPEMIEAMGSARMVPIGSVPEGEVVHVVCRTSVDVSGLKVSKVEVVSLKRVDGRWRVLIPESMKGIFQALNAPK